ncbi:pyridoxal-phosphate dependent enzyme [Flexivirga sp. ID2601S]|uniref:threonine ammonia-lyase n=1 Tax=Flexivirga aerilata TaxID=1656889 RepID=A0A849A9T0_9MICO|nr:pyridoxal-phosphate dependent enzyme [Flexivirga aerilata]NNG37674.1 pyridoxal-phosphate dependent enzyme [Flexivirga aerilata]
MTSLSFAGVLQAADAIAGELPPTPAWSYPALNQEVGAEVIVKHENVQPTGAFKVRGGVAFAASLTGADRTAGLVTASTGNHAQSVAYAARLLGAPAVIVMPHSAAAEKEHATRLLGADVVRHGDTMGAALDHARDLAASRGMRFVSPGDEPAIVHGHATVYLELLRRHAGLDAIYVPVGSGSGAAAACLVRDELAPDCAVIGVQSAAAPAAYNSWRAGEVLEASCATRVAGVATSRGCELPLSVMCDRLDDFLLVDDGDIMAAMRLMSSAAHTLAEGAGATALAGALAHSARPGRIGVICTGGNADAGELAELAVTPVLAAG